MCNNLKLIWLLLALLAAFPASAGPDGKALYQKHCVVCHRDTGLGGIGLPLSAAKINTFPDNYIINTIRNGRPGRVMPAFETLSDIQVKAILEHMRSWHNGEPPPVYSDAPIAGDVERGHELYHEHCISCHGEHGSGEGQGTGVTMSRERRFEVMPPAINNVGFLAAASDQFIYHIIAHGQPGSIMPAYKDTIGLKDKDINDIVAYVRSLEETAREARADKPDIRGTTLIFESPYDFDTTVENLKSAIKGMNFRYFPDRYLEQGLTDEASVNKKQLALRFCNFNNLYELLKIEPRLGVLLPCRLTVIEDQTGKVSVIALDMNLASKFFNNDELDDFAYRMHQIQMELIEEALL